MSAPLETLGVECVKFGETLTGNADGNPEPSPVMGRCRDLTAHTYGRNTMVKRKSRPQTERVTKVIVVRYAVGSGFKSLWAYWLYKMLMEKYYDWKSNRSFY